MLYIVGYWHLFNYTSAFPSYNNLFTSKLTLILLGLFVLLSGFLVGKSSTNDSSVFGFYKKKLFRIYPLYALAVILFYLYDLNSSIVSIKSLIFVSMYLGPTPKTLWFITMVFSFYLITPLSMKWIENPIKFLAMNSFIFIIIFILLIILKTVDYRILLYFPSYCLGLYCSRYGLVTRAVNYKVGVLSLLIWVGIFLIETNSWTLNQLKNIPLVLSFSYLIFLVSHLNENKLKNFKIISKLSYSSYAMYLFHRPIYSSLIYLYFPSNNNEQVLYLMGPCLLIVFFLSWAIQKLYDSMRYTKFYSRTN